MLKYTLTAALLAAIFATTADAQFDHLQCHKVKDPQKLADVVVSLGSAEAQFQMPGNCKLAGKAPEFCVAADKTVVDAGNSAGSLIGAGQELTGNGYLCYKIKCPKAVVADALVTDQFGARTLTKIKPASKLCVPTVMGVVTTTTTTTTTLPFCDGTLCGGTCIDEQTDPQNCGACGNVCSTSCTGNVTATTCSTGTCSITGCTAGRLDMDHVCSNGCECQDQATGGSACATAQNLTINPGGSVDVSGNLVTAGQESWRHPTFTAGGSTRTIQFASNPGNQFSFDVYSTCGGAPVSCLNPFSCTVAAGSYYVKVRHTTGVTTPTCASYTLRFTN